MKKLLLMVFLLMSLAACAEEEKILNVYNWTEYLPAEILQQFTKETGIKVNYATYESNEAMYAKLKTLQGDAYDLAVPSSSFVSRMIRQKMLIKLDKTKLPNFKNLDPNFLNKTFDPNNEYSVPYAWSTIGIAINIKQAELGSVTKLADLWNPKYKNAILLLDDRHDVMGLGLKALGYSCNDTNEEHIKQAYQKLKELLPNVKMFHSDSPKAKLLEGEVKLGVVWNGEVYAASKENPDIQYIYPRDGVVLLIDNLVIPVGAKHPDNAHKLINFLLRPDIAKIFIENLGYPAPNMEAVKLLAKDVAENHIIYPTAEELKGAELQAELSDEAVKIFDKYWQQLKAGGK